MNQLASTLTFKLLVGIVLTSAMVISLVYLSQDLHTYLNQFENKELFQISFFGFLLIINGIGLFLLLMKNKTAPVEENNPLSISGLLSLDLKVLGIKFIEGFITGLMKESEENKDENKK